MCAYVPVRLLIWGVGAHIFGLQAGVYEAALLVGDPQALDGIAWYLGQAELVLPTSDPAPTVRSAHTQPISNVRPVINHLFVSVRAHAQRAACPGAPAVLSSSGLTTQLTTQ